MATLLDLQSGRRRPLPARLTVGRAPTCGLVLDDPHVSGEHAVLTWTRGSWTVRDLGSRNGTWVDGNRLAPGDTQALTSGSELGFAHPEASCRLVDPSAPGPVAEALDRDGFRASVDGLLALPDEAHPEVVVLQDGRGRWWAERADGARSEVADGAVLTVSGVPWRVLVPVELGGTATVDVGPRLETVKVRFAVSRDEEHVELTLLHRGQAIPLEAREHGYVLLTLARLRLAEADQPLAEQGWIDRDALLKMLGIDANALNVAIYRARGQLSAAGLEDAAGIVEVRRGSRRLGIEPDRLEVVSL